MACNPDWGWEIDRTCRCDVAGRYDTCDEPEEHPEVKGVGK